MTGIETTASLDLETSTTEAGLSSTYADLWTWTPKIEIQPISFPSIGLAAPSYMSINGYKECLGEDSSMGWTMLCLPKEKPSDCLQDSWSEIIVEFTGEQCPDLEIEIEPWHPCELSFIENINSSYDCDLLCQENWNCSNWDFNDIDMLCTLHSNVCTNLPMYTSFYPYGKLMIVEDVSKISRMG